jgi:tetratricopeptide (TPR) repeat protein|tara:strand:+ start:21 stop:581 length:561 start_codon:yes stop_codon:yes gene_type:complete
MSNEDKSLTIEEVFSHAIKNHQEGKTDVAQDLYNQILKINPNHTGALNNLGAIFKELKDYQKAKKFYEKSIEINPNYAVAYNNLGAIFMELKDYQKGKGCFEKAIEINPNYVNANYNLGVIKDKLKNFKEAASMYKKALDLNPLDKKSLAAYGKMMLRLNEHEKGLEYIEKGEGVIKFTPKYCKII